MPDAEILIRTLFTGSIRGFFHIDHMKFTGLYNLNSFIQVTSINHVLRSKSRMLFIIKSVSDNKVRSITARFFRNFQPVAYIQVHV